MRSSFVVVMVVLAVGMSTAALTRDLWNPLPPLLLTRTAQKAKITKEIAAARGIPFPATSDCNSPPFHSEFSNAEGMMDFVGRLREMSGGKPVGIKLCIGRPEEFVSMIHAMIKLDTYPDFITIDGGEGGTGAAPPEFSNSVGTPLIEALTFANNALRGAGVREHVKIICSGKVLTGFSIVERIALGADLCNAARAMMYAMGCIQVSPTSHLSRRDVAPLALAPDGAVCTDGWLAGPASRSRTHPGEPWIPGAQVQYESVPDGDRDVGQGANGRVGGRGQVQSGCQLPSAHGGIGMRDHRRARVRQLGRSATHPHHEANR